MWPFAKLRNGFGSHRYLYSPILFDSQELILFYLSTRSSCHAGGATSPYTILQRSIGLCQWNGGYQFYHLRFLAAAGAACIAYTTTVGWLPSMEWNGVAPATPGALRTRIPDAGKRAWFSVMEVNWRASRFRCRCSVPYMSPVGLGFGNGNGECRRCSWIAAQAAASAGSATLYWGAVEGVMDNEEWSTEHGNI